MNYLEFFVILSPKVRLDKVVSHRVCLDQVSLRSDDAKLMDNLMSYVKIIIFFVYPANKTDAAEESFFSNMAVPILTAKDFRGLSS